MLLAAVNAQSDGRTGVVLQKLLTSTVVRSSAREISPYRSPRRTSRMRHSRTPKGNSIVRAYPDRAQALFEMPAGLAPV